MSIFVDLFLRRVPPLPCGFASDVCAVSPVRGFMQYRQNRIFSGKSSPQWGHFFVAPSMIGSFSRLGTPGSVPPVGCSAFWCCFSITICPPNYYLL
jgi:hypothetical protein